VEVAKISNFQMSVRVKGSQCGRHDFPIRARVPAVLSSPAHGLLTTIRSVSQAQRTSKTCPRNFEDRHQLIQMCLRRARRVKRMARRSPSTAPINASKIVLLSNERAPLPAIRKPQYAIAIVQRIMRRLFMGAHLSISKYCHTFVP